MLATTLAAATSTLSMTQQMAKNREKDKVDEMYLQLSQIQIQLDNFFSQNMASGKVV